MEKQHGINCCEFSCSDLSKKREWTCQGRTVNYRADESQLSVVCSEDQ